MPEGLELDFVRASSYGAGTQSSGQVKLGTSTLTESDIMDRHILLVSLTLQALFEFMLWIHGDTMPVEMAPIYLRAISRCFRRLQKMVQGDLDHWLHQADNRALTHGCK